MVLGVLVEWLGPVPVVFKLSWLSYQACQDLVDRCQHLQQLCKLLVQKELHHAMMAQHLLS